MTSSGLRLLYLVHDVADPAVRKRMAMLRAGGAVVRLAGFRRSAAPQPPIDGIAALDLGQTYNAGFLQRILSVCRIIIGMKRQPALLQDCDVIIARNLEMLAIGVRARSLMARPPRLFYESLDIHRLLLRPDMLGRALRGLEGWLCRRAAGLLTSSPAFIAYYFTPLSAVRLPVHLVENKVFSHEQTAPAFTPARPAGPPWRLGWFGAIRCRKSLSLLKEAAARLDGKLEVIIRGRSAYDQFDDFDAAVANTPHLSFKGPYRNPEDLEAIYSDVHFTWAIDLFEEGQNSSWLLPNRLYEGGRYASVPVALWDVEIGRFTKRLGLGVQLESFTADNLISFFSTLTAADYSKLSASALSVPPTTWTATTDDCTSLINFLISPQGPLS